MFIEDGGEWVVRIAPQCMTDILVQVCRSDPDANDPAIFTFCIGELMREALDDLGCLDGLLEADDAEAANIERWASQMEAYAAIMRSALRCRRVKGSNA